MAARFLHCSLPVLWARKSRRTECLRSSPPAPPSSFLSQNEEDCIIGLLMLSSAPLGGVPPLPAPMQQPVLLPRSSPQPTTRKEEPYPISFHGVTPLLPPPPPEQHPSPPAQKQQDLPLLPPPLQGQEQFLLLSPALKQQRQKDPLTPPMTPSTDDLLRYKCSECGKAFSSFLALGGHKSSHYRKRPSPSPLPEKQRHVKARRSLAMTST